MILRITYFRWGSSCNNWYADGQELKRQLDTEKNRKRSPDVTGEEWFQVSPLSAEELKELTK